MQTVIIIFGAAAGIALLAFAYSLYVKVSYRSHRKTTGDRQTQNSSVQPDRPACPLCGTRLVPGENLKSRIFHPINREIESDQRCFILGCPHCLDRTKNLHRKCPVCGKSVPRDGYLLARLFVKKKNKHHVHIIGCSECHKKL